MSEKLINPASDCFFFSQYSIRFYEVPFPAMPERSWGYAPLPYQDYGTQNRTLALHSLAVLPGLQDDVAGLIPGIPTLKVLISLHTQVTDNQPVLDKDFTPKAIAIDCFYF